MGFAVTRGVSTDDAGCSLCQIQRLHKGLGQPTGLVGNHPPIQMGSLYRIQNPAHPGKQAGFYRQVILVNLQQFTPQGIVSLITGSQTKSILQQRAGTLGGMGTDLCKW